MNIFLGILLSTNREQSWVWLLAGAAGGVYLFYRGFRMLQRKRLILDTPTSKIRSASMGLVEISGLAEGQNTLVAPITGLPCYYYKTIAWQLKRSGKNEKWEIVAEECLHVPFYINDNTGRLLVDPNGAEMDIHRDFHEEFSASLFSSSFEPPANVSAFLSRHGVSSDRKTKVDEFCIKPKNALFVLGTLESNIPEAAGGEISQFVGNESMVPETIGSRNLPSSLPNPRPPAVIRLSSEPAPVNSASMTPQGKIAAALMKAGIANPAAWTAAGIGDFGGVSSSANHTTSAALAVEIYDSHPAVVLKKGIHNPTFFISWKSQKEILKSLGWKSTAMIWGGPALTLSCVYILALYLNWL